MAYPHKRDINNYRIDGKSEHNADISILVALCLFAIIMLAALIATQNRTVLSTELTSFFIEINKERNSGFQLGPLKLGATLQSHRAKRPDGVVSVNAKGNIALSFEESGATFTVWYGGPEKQLAYRTRMSTAFEGNANEDAIDAIIKRYGSPSITSCDRRVTDGVLACNYSWWLPSDIRVDIASRVSAPIRGDNTGQIKSGTLTTMVTDTRLMGRVLRAGRPIDIYAARQ